MKHNQLIYHVLKGFPKDLVLPSKTYVLNYTKHAKQEALRDQYAEKINLPLFLDFSSTNINEVYVEGKAISKLVCKENYNDHLDLFLVIDPNDKSVITVWLDVKKDFIDRRKLNKYNRPSTF